MALTKEDLQAIRDMMKIELEPINRRLDGMQDNIATLKEGQEVIRKSQLRVENEELPKIGAAIDGFYTNKDRSDQLEERILFLEKKADIHDTRLFVLERDIKAE
jgi:hypothetical protein